MKKIVEDETATLKFTIVNKRKMSSSNCDYSRNKETKNNAHILSKRCD